MFGRGLPDGQHITFTGSSVPKQVSALGQQPAISQIVLSEGQIPLYAFAPHPPAAITSRFWGSDTRRARSNALTAVAATRKRGMERMVLREYCRYEN